MSATNRPKADGTRGARPFLKWVGGKTQLLPELLKYVPSKFGTYYEPFLGGGALFFALQPQEAILGDSNPALVNCYRCVQDNLGDLLLGLHAHAVAHSEEHYYAARQHIESEPREVTATDNAAAFIYINKAGFNGLWRVNKAGKCNVPWGKHETFKPDADNLTACSATMDYEEVEVIIRDFIFAESAERGDFVYFDPPYVPASTTANFTGYTRDGFNDADQRRLVDVAAKLVDRGVHVVLSNSDTPRTRQLYSLRSYWDIHEVKARRAINCVGGKRGAVGELIITGKV